MRKRGKGSLQNRILLFLLICWVVPIAAFFVFTTISYRNNIMEKTETLVEDQLENVSSYISIRFDEAISLSQKPSYERQWESMWEQYQRKAASRNTYLQGVNTNLRSRFSLDKRFNAYAFYLKGEVTPGCYSSRAGDSFSSYVDEIHPQIQRVIDGQSSYASIKVINQRIFIVRNLFTTDTYEYFGTLVLEMSRRQLFQDLPDDIQDTMQICIDEEQNSVRFGIEENDKSVTRLIDTLMQSYGGGNRTAITKEKNKTYNAYLYQKNYDNYRIGVIYWAQRNAIYSSLYESYFMTVIVMLLFIPIILYGIYFFRRQIQKPMKQLVKASKKMEEGKIGIEVEGPEMPNLEFGYLKDSFDSMSSQVKYLFDYVYDEKMARKDAQIQALQAQINPHFLNNTLEMMNWQARMSGDAVVSKMIEALGTVMDYRMNRANVKEIHLAEELQCTEAYFYIMSMRFGQRLQIEKEIDEELLYIPVPPLVLQPIVENAIVHGVEMVKNGTIRLKIYHDEQNVYLSVYNSGKPLTEEETEKISAILAGDDARIPKHQGHHTSIGIRNVNKRIQLVYGEKYGLTIERGEDDLTVSTITIPFHNTELVESDNEIMHVEEELKNLQKAKK